MPRYTTLREQQGIAKALPWRRTAKLAQREPADPTPEWMRPKFASAEQRVAQKYQGFEDRRREVGRLNAQSTADLRAATSAEARHKQYMSRPVERLRSPTRPTDALPWEM
jgi:hypothetical protein